MVGMEIFPHYHCTNFRLANLYGEKNGYSLFCFGNTHTFNSLEICNPLVNKPKNQGVQIYI